MEISQRLKKFESFGIKCVPLKPKSKACLHHDWPNRVFSKDDFKEDNNIGLLTGKCSNGYMDVDLDWPEAVQIAHYYLPPTQFIFGRESKPSSHLGYRSKGGTKTIKYTVPGGGVILELRGDDCQTMGPWSTHPSGEPVVWVHNEELNEYHYEEIKRGAGRAAAACVLLRNMVPGIRHDLSIAIIGLLLRSSWTPEMVIDFMTPILDHGAKDNRAASIISNEIEKLSLKKSNQNGRLPGYTRLKQIIGESASCICEWLGITKKEEFVPNVISLRALSEKEFAPKMWIIDEILPEGVTILFGRPKSRKSFLALNLAIATANGGIALGKYAANKHDVLFLALEDSEQRIQSRAKSLALEGELMPENFLLSTEWQNGDVDAIRDVLDVYPGVKLVIIDTWTVFRHSKGSGRNKTSYQAEYQELQELTRLAKERHIAIILIGHARKSIDGLEQADLTENINGSMGIAGAADSIMGLYWTRGENNAILHMTGRDIEEQNIYLVWDERLMCWRAEGDAEERADTHARQQMLDIISEQRQATIKELSAIIKKSYHATNYLVHKLVEEGLIWRDMIGNRNVYKIRRSQQEEF